MLTISTNISNLRLQRNLSAVNSATQTALGRLSTGYRINSAKDDAAGMVISKALDVQTRGLDIANQNAQTGVNVLSVADGALSQMSDLVMRVRDLSLQASSGGYGATERDALELEAKELTSNLKQLIEGTKFNNFKIFEGPEQIPRITEEEAIAQGYSVIKTAQELQAIASGNMGGKYMLVDDIDLSSISNWNVIGLSDAFTGTFDGNGYTIKNLTINSAANNQGFFGNVDGAIIKNVNLENVNIQAGNSVGALIGNCNMGTIINCSSTGNIAGTGSLGGLIGYSFVCTISDSYSTANVTGTSDNVGGLLGYNFWGITSNCYSAGNVTGKGSVGGFAGANNGAIRNSFSTGRVSSTFGSDANSYFGGFVGNNYGEISNCYSTGQNEATTGKRGGFVGYNDISQSSYANNSYISQTGGFAVSGDGTIIVQTTQQPASWFSGAPNLQSILGTDSFDFSSLPPCLKWQVKSNKLTFQIGTDGTDLSAITVDTGFSLNNFSLSFSTQDSARSTIEKCDSLIKQINTKRGELGASTNIISSIIEGNNITNENLTAAKSRIQDANIAKESANMVKNQILQNATTALLAQSQNINGNLALQLLNGIKN